MHHRRLAPLGTLARFAPAVIVLWSLACSASGPHAVRPDPRAAEPSLVFENTTTESVTIYLVADVGQWLVGNAEPGRTARLRFPPSLGARRGREFSILVIRAGGRRDQTSLIRARTNIMRSETIAGEHLTAIRWKLTDRQLVATPLSNY